MIKIEFPADRTDIAVAIGKALLEIGGQTTGTTHEVTHTAGDVSITEKITTAGAVDHGEGGIGTQADMGDYEGDTAGAAGTDTTETASSDTRVDHNGVGFNEDFCGKAAKPFYSSGRQQGQWKKRQGVDQAEYDTWYAVELAVVDTSTEAKTTDQVDTASAFGGQDVATDTDAPTTCGEFMVWATGKQTAGLITQKDVTDAYAHSGLAVPDLMPPTPTERMVHNIGVVYGILKQKADANG